MSYSNVGFDLFLNRRLEPFLMNVYMPTGLLVATSWIGFLVPVSAIPGRMALLVTTLLMLISVSNQVRSSFNSYNSVYPTNY